MYVTAFDPFNGIYRMLHILSLCCPDGCIETDRIRIYDFYMLFPYKTYKIRLRSTETDFRLKRAKYIKKEKSPYNIPGNDRRLFEQLKRYQLIALGRMASYGLIDPADFTEGMVRVADKEKMQTVMHRIEPLTTDERNVVSWLDYCFRNTPLNGEYGLKYRTQLLDYKYDGC